MTKDAKELKDFIEWAKSQRIKRIKVSKGTTEVEFSDLAFIDGLGVDDLSNAYSANASTSTPRVKEEASTSKTLTDTLQPNASEEDEDLYWSSIP
jgi:hypothetical protein